MMIALVTHGIFTLFILQGRLRNDKIDFRAKENLQILWPIIIIVIEEV